MERDMKKTEHRDSTTGRLVYVSGEILFSDVEAPVRESERRALRSSLVDKYGAGKFSLDIADGLLGGTWTFQPVPSDEDPDAGPEELALELAKQMQSAES
jgi:hypothetical protein